MFYLALYYVSNVTLDIKTNFYEGLLFEVLFGYFCHEFHRFLLKMCSIYIYYCLESLVNRYILTFLFFINNMNITKTSDNLIWGSNNYSN